jgi:CSLREA domain-containing protein
MKRLSTLLAVFLVALGTLGFFISLVKTAKADSSGGLFTVNSTADVTDFNPGDGVCETANGNSVCTLRAAIMEANNLTGADSIMLPAGYYLLTIDGNDDNAAVGDLDIREALTINGDGADVTIIDGNFIDRIFHVDTPNNHLIMMEGITIQQGNNSHGAGICNCSTGTEVVLSSFKILSNTASNWGGGVRNLGEMSLIHSAIISNSAQSNGGGIENESTAVMVISNSMIALNTAYFDGLGGGISNNGILSITASTIWDNEARSFGIGSTGGGIYNTGQLWLENSTVGENTALSAGGGIYSNDFLRVDYSTIFSNTTINGGASSIFIYSGQAALGGSIIAGTGGNNCFGALTSDGYNLESGNSCGLTSTGDITNAIPLLGPLQNNGGPTLTYALLVGSPAIDTADNLNCPVTDQRGFPRPFDGDGDDIAVCDIGSFELGESVFTIFLPVFLNP